MTTDKLQSKFEELLGRLENAKDGIDGGVLGSLEELNKDILAACAEVQHASPETAKALQVHMGKVILKLDELAASITDYKDKLQGQ